MDPLQGLRVVDMSQNLAGPYYAQILPDLERNAGVFRWKGTFHRLCEALGLPELPTDPRFAADLRSSTGASFTISSQ